MLVRLTALEFDIIRGASNPNDADFYREHGFLLEAYCIDNSLITLEIFKKIVNKEVDIDECYPKDGSLWVYYQ